jgi:alpha-glucosidase
LRRSGDERFIGCLTNWDPRDLKLPLDFLGDGKPIAETYADAADAGIHPTRTEIRQQDASLATKLRIRLASGGGVAVRIRAVVP